MGGQVVRAMPRNAAPITIEVDGEPVEAWTGESVLVAVLAYRGALRRLEFGNEPRAGFCLMGACQDCWIEIAGLGRTRACTTPVAAGMRILTGPPSHG